MLKRQPPKVNTKNIDFGKMALKILSVSEKKTILQSVLLIQLFSLRSRQAKKKIEQRRQVIPAAVQQAIEREATEVWQLSHRRSWIDFTRLMEI